LSGDFVVEVHPGFTGLKSYRYRGGRLSCRGIERDLRRLVECLNTFRRELQERVEVDLVFSLEPRAGGVISEHLNWGSDKQEPCWGD